MDDIPKLAGKVRRPFDPTPLIIVLTFAAFAVTVILWAFESV